MLKHDERDLRFIDKFVAAVKVVGGMTGDVDRLGEDVLDYELWPMLLTRLHDEVGEESLGSLSQIFRDANDSEMRCPK